MFPGVMITFEAKSSSHSQRASIKYLGWFRITRFFCSPKEGGITHYWYTIPINLHYLTHLIHLDSEPTPQSHALIRKRRQLQPLHRKLERVIPRITPRRVEIEPAPDTVVEIHIYADNSLVIFPLRPGENVTKGGDDGGAAARGEFGFGCSG